jgi:hypothetical protein
MIFFKNLIDVERFIKVDIAAMETGPTGNVYVSGEQPLTPEGNNSFITQWDNETWAQLNTSKLKTAQSIAVDRSRRLYANSQWTVHYLLGWRRLDNHHRRKSYQVKTANIVCTGKTLR